MKLINCQVTRTYFKNESINPIEVLNSQAMMPYCRNMEQKKPNNSYLYTGERQNFTFIKQKGQNFGQKGMSQ